MKALAIVGIVAGCIVLAIGAAQYIQAGQDVHAHREYQAMRRKLAAAEADALRYATEEDTLLLKVTLPALVMYREDLWETSLRLPAAPINQLRERQAEGQFLVYVGLGIVLVSAVLLVGARRPAAGP